MTPPLESGLSTAERVHSKCERRAHPYVRRQPENGVLHRVLREHLETFLEEARLRGGGEGLPAFIEREQLLARWVRHLVPTEAGRLAFEYA